MSNSFIPFHKPFYDEDEINEVVDTINSGWWTTGPKVQQFEKHFNNYIGSRFSVSAASWTAAAHLALEAIGLKENDEVIVPSFTFTSTAEIVCYFKAKPIIVDIDKETFNINPAEIEKAVTKKTKVIIPVHYGGQPCEIDEIKRIALKNNIKIIEDAAHALPAFYKERKIGSISDVTCFSFYATKTLATGEGGMICTDDEEIAERCAIMRLHGISKDAWKRYSSEGSWYYEVIAPGFKYNLTDIQAALGLAQLRKVEQMWKMREIIFNKYNLAFKDNESLSIPVIKEGRISSYHLYPLLLKLETLNISRSQFIDELKKRNVGASVHFIPLYRHPFYKDYFNLKAENYPVSENIYKRILSLPIWPGMNNKEIDTVVESVNFICKKYRK